MPVNPATEIHYFILGINGTRALSTVVTRHTGDACVKDCLIFVCDLEAESAFIFSLPFRTVL